MNKIYIIIVLLLMTIFSLSLKASKLVSVSVIDEDHIMVFFQDGEVVFDENAATSELIPLGDELNTSIAKNNESWLIKSADDPNFGLNGILPVEVFRKSKLTGMSQEHWDHSVNDYHYEWAYEHGLFLQLPFSMQNEKTYTLEIDQDLNSDSLSVTFTYDIFTSRSEAIKVNVVGYSPGESIKIADVYMWMGDGGSRDYTSFENNHAYVYNVETGDKLLVDSLQFWKNSAPETSSNHQMIRSAVWSVDFSSITAPGKYRIAIEGIGCSDDFVIADDIYAEPARVSTLGFFYMRIGQDNLFDMVPVPRRPLYIPGVSPPNTTVYITTMHPYHPEWNTFASGDKWDRKDEWAKYVKPGNPTNPNAYGGHSDALDWDRHLGHVSIIYDMLFPYIITDGVLDDDNMGIPESGNGIPDILDEARNEVDFWLRLRDGKGYSHGINNPNSNNVFYQAGNTAVAAWANAVNAAMLSNAFLVSGNTELMQIYRDSAIIAYNYASELSDQMLDKSQGIGIGHMTGKDFKATAAAYLYNITGETSYEDEFMSLCTVNSNSSPVNTSNFNQLYALIAYLFTNQEVNYPERYNNMKQSLINEAKSKEANYSNIRPSRRATDNNDAWFVTFLQVQRTIAAHALSEEGSADRTLFENALTLEADWSLGRNPLNMILMTTATTDLADETSVPNAYTSGWNDGTPGVHPGHTPYMNIYDWGGGIRGEPTWMTKKNYPNASLWPYGEMYYNTRYVWAANEFTPQQTMRGKQALYSYLYALLKPRIVPATGLNVTPQNNTLDIGDSLQLGATLLPENATNNGVRWSSDNTSVATVDANGWVTGKGEGTVMIKATAKAGNSFDVASVEVNIVNVQGIAIEPDSITIFKGDKYQLKAIFEPSNASNKNVSWKSDNTSVATVNSKGLVTGRGAGSTNIMVTSADGGFMAQTTVVVETNTHISSENENQQFKIFPNPAKGIINIELPPNVTDAKMSLLDMSGAYIIKNQLVKYKHRLEIDQLTPNIYILEFVFEKSREYLKIVVE